MRWAAVDFETATREADSACQLGVVVVEDGIEIARQDWLIRPPENRYEVWNTRIHNIAAADTEDSASFAEVWDEASELIEDRPIVAHNAAFDIRVIRRCCTSFAITHPENEYFCTVRLARRTWPELSAYKLPIVAAHVGQELQHHDALSDAVACSEIARACTTAAGNVTLPELYQVHKLKLERINAI